MLHTMSISPFDDGIRRPQFPIVRKKLVLESLNPTKRVPAVVRVEEVKNEEVVQEQPQEQEPEVVASMAAPRSNSIFTTST